MCTWRLGDSECYFLLELLCGKVSTNMLSVCRDSIAWHIIVTSSIGRCSTCLKLDRYPGKEWMDHVSPTTAAPQMIETARCREI